MRSLAAWVHGRSVEHVVRDDGSPGHPRTPEELILENTDLRQMNLMLSGQLEKLKELDAERARLGDLRSYCLPVKITGADAGPRDSLQINAGSVQGLRDGMAVLSADGLIGRLVQVGLASSRLRLISDKGNKVFVAFARFETDEKGTLIRKD